MKDLIKKLIKEYFDKEPELIKSDKFNLLIQNLGTTETPGKKNSYTFTLGPTKIYFKPTSKKNVIELDLIETDKEMRGKGSAKKALNMFLDEIDALKLSVILSIVPRDKTTSAEGLKNFYLDFGFNSINDFQMIY